MSHNTIQVPSDDYDRFVDAARAAAKPELGKLVQATIAALREMDAYGSRISLTTTVQLGMQ